VEPAPLGAGDGELLRAARLAALRDCPEAFGARLEREQGYDDARWRELLAWGRWWVTGDLERPSGVVAVVTDHGRPHDERHLVSMWVDPAQRGSGTADALVRAACAGAAEDGAARLTLWVVEANARARAFYARAGFADTGERAAPHPGVVELRLARRL
jgi:ribosomal protein S18 acetylase RimI-like enzyme